MFEILRRSPWSRPDPGGPPVLSESAWLTRRSAIRALGLGGIAAAAASCAPARAQDGGDDEPEFDNSEEAVAKRGYPLSSRWIPEYEPVGGAERYPAERNMDYNPGRILTPEDDAASFNNFYEFLPGRAGPVRRYIRDFQPRPWEVAITGEVEEEKTVGVDDLVAAGDLEERFYRFRCVEAWSMTVP